MAIRKQLIAQYGEVPALQRYEIIDKINQLNNIRDRALIAFLYLTGARIEEVVRHYKKDQETGTMKMKDYPILKKQIELSDKYIFVRDVRSLKRRNKKPYKRDIPIPKHQNDEFFIKTFLDHYYTVADDDPLFNITRQRASQILGKVNLFNHWLRHTRDTHLVRDYKFSAAELRHFNNWRSSSTADIYTHLNLDDLLNKFERR